MAAELAHQFALHRGKQVLGVVLLDLDVLVAGHPEGVMLEHLHAGEELREVGGDDVLERDEPLLGHWQEPRKVRRHLDPGEVLGGRSRVANDDREVEREPGDVRERVRGVDRQRSQHREDPFSEQLPQPDVFCIVEIVPAGDLDALLLQGGQDVVMEAVGLARHELPGTHQGALVYLTGQRGGNCNRINPSARAAGVAWFVATK